MAEPQIKSGDDVTHLMGDINSGDDVTSLMNAGGETPKPEAKQSEIHPAVQRVTQDPKKQKWLNEHPYIKRVLGQVAQAGETALNPGLGIEKYGINPLGEGLLPSQQEAGLSTQPRVFPGRPRLTQLEEQLQGKSPNDPAMYESLIRPLSSPAAIAGEAAMGATKLGNTFGDWNRLKAADWPGAPFPQLTQPKGLLPPATNPEVVPQQPTMIAGPSGIRRGAAPANISPDIAARIAGISDVPQTGSSGATGTAVDTGELAEARRQAALRFTQAAQRPGESIDIPSGPLPTELPPQSGETTGGFSPETDPTKSLGYPLDIVPNRLRPRTAQTEILGRTGLRGEDLSTPEPQTSDITFQSDKGPDVEQEPPESYSGVKYDAQGNVVPQEAQLPTAVKRVSDILDKDPKVATGDVPKPSLDATLQHPNVAQIPTDNVLPKPGQARPTKDIAAISANFNSAHKMLPSSITEPILTANDNKLQWIRQTLDSFTEFSQGLNKQGRIQLFNILDGGPTDGVDPNILQRAQGARQVLDSIFSEIPDFDGHYLKDYITHIQKMPEDLQAGLKTLWDWQGLTKIFDTSVEGGGQDVLYEKGIGDPHSVFTEERTGNLRELERDFNRVIPAYVESIAKEIFDKPAVDAAKVVLKGMQNSKLKELAAWYIKNYTRYDAEEGLHNAWNAFANAIGTTTARSVVAFNPGIHMLHVGEIPANIFPELGTKYTMEGLKQVGSKPIQVWSEMARKGLLQSEIKPFAFKTPMEKFDSASYFFSYVESLVKGVGYYGAKAKFLAQGMPEAQADMQALRATKDMTLTVDPARAMKGLSPESNVMGGEVGSRLGWQFKGIPFKIVEQYKDIIKNVANDPKKAARLTGGVSLALAGTGLGMHTFHVNPTSLLTTTAFGPFATAIGTVAKDLSKGDLSGALVDTAKWATPGGATISKAYKIINPPDKSAPKPVTGAKQLKFTSP